MTSETAMEENDMNEFCYIIVTITPSSDQYVWLRFVPREFRVRTKDVRTDR